MLAPRDLSRLLRPRSVAVMGGGWAANVVEQCLKMGFAGEVWPVHPSKAAVGGVRAYPSLAALPGAPDATFIGVNRHATVDVVAELSAMGAGGAVCFASGWAETGERDLQARLVEAAGAMPILGPNCYGLVNYLDGAAIWPDQHGGRREARGVAIVSQSSNIAINLTMQARGLPLAYILCLGNAAQTGLAEVAGALLADERVTALGLYLEGVGDAPALAALAEAARAAGKGIVAVKSGKSAAGAAAAATHTASLAGGGAASSAFLAQAGIGEVPGLSDLLEALKILHVHGPLSGRRLSITACSGGEAGLSADLSAGLPFEFPAPAGEAAARLSAVLGPLVTLANPLDYQTFIWGDEGKIAEVFSAMMAGADAGFFVIDPPREDRCDPASFVPALRAIETAGRVSGKPAFPVASLAENFGEERARDWIARGVAPLMGLESALLGLRGATAPAGRAGWRPWAARAERPARLLPEDEAKALLAAAGVSVPLYVAAPTLPALRMAAAALRPPLALKGLGFLHKTEAGAVRLGLSTLAREGEMPGASGYLAEEMVAGAVAELLVGLRRDPVYGGTLTIGFGGREAELLEDVETLILPVTGGEIEAALRRRRLFPLLDGFRGRARGDVAAAVSAALSMQKIMERDARIVEIEVNPLMVLPQGAVAVDAVIREAET
ncbi:MAG: acetate--CoA ligase family protein [Pikeienuella sp.]|uniref:acetate--CoA ligase family protein n=1 Tax=Pikeienuella sp. TaxID=2831957 RepID=UPI00391A7FF6